MPDPVLLNPVLLNLGSGPHVAPGWTAIDASWNAWLAAHPRLRAAVRALGLVAPEHDAVGWPTAGIVYHDVRRGLPFKDASVAGIFAAHFLEHLTPPEARALVAECRRVLAPGAALRVIVPDLEAMTRAYARSLESEDAQVRALAAARYLAALNLDGFRAWPPGLAHALARRFSRAGHRALYDRHALTALLTDAGLAGVGPRAPLDSALPLVAQVERPELHEFAVCVEGHRLTQLHHAT